MASNKQSKLKDTVDEGIVQPIKVKIYTLEVQQNKKTANGERMFYALLTDGTVPVIEKSSLLEKRPLVCNV